jgi:hypothetical protein
LNQYVEIKNSFQFLECAVRQRETLTSCSLPRQVKGKRADSALRDYLFCLMLVSAIAQLEYDIDKLRDVPGLHRTNKLSVRLQLLRVHYQIDGKMFDAIDRLRDARNRFVHEGESNLDAGCTKAEIPGIIVTFLQRCQHPEYA